MAGHFERFPLRRNIAFLVIALFSGMGVDPLHGVAQTATPEDPETPFAISTQANVDENLFAFRMLAAIYASWPDLHQDHDKVRARFDSFRQNASVMRGRVHARRLDPSLELAYGDLLDYISATETYLASLDLIERQRSNQAPVDAIVAVIDAIQKGSDTSSAAQPYMSPEGAADAGKLVGLADGLYQLNARAEARDQAAQTATAAAARRLQDQWSSVLASLQVTSQRLSARYGWAPGEAGFDGFSGNNIADYVNRSPRDPFLRARYAEAVFNAARSANDAVPAINAYLLAAELVPADTAYDAIRLEYLQDATLAAVDGAALDGGAAYSLRKAPYTNALKLTRTYLAVDSNDATGFGHVELARALAFAGRYREAAWSAQAAMNLDQTWRTDPAFVYRYAKLMALNGDPDQALSSLKHAYEIGFTHVDSVKTDPDLASVRQQRPKPFAELTSPRWSWRIQFGNMAPDSVVLQNDSPFDLVNPKLAVHVRQGQQVWDKTVTCPRVQAGHSCQVDDVFFITGNYIDEGTASLTFDP